jgi:hypothetical protein
MGAKAVVLPPGSYYQLALLVGSNLSHPLPQPFLFDGGLGPLPIPISCGIYVAFDPSWAVAYVGSVARPENPRGLEARVNEHLREQRKAFIWLGIYVLPLHSTIPAKEVRRLEGHVGRVLRPLMSMRLPS